MELIILISNFKDKIDYNLSIEIFQVCRFLQIPNITYKMDLFDML